MNIFSGLSQNDRSLEFVDWWTPGIAPFTQKRRQTISNLKIACIVGDRLFEGLSFEAELFLLTPTNWKTVLRSVDIDILLVESCWVACTGDWYLAQYPAGESRQELDELVCRAKQMNIPTVYWNTQDFEYHEHYSDIAKNFEHVFCADDKELAALKSESVKASFLPPAVQPAIFNGFMELEDRNSQNIPILYDGWSNLFRNQEKLQILETLIPHGLSIIESRNLIFINRRGELAPYSSNILGCTTSKSRQTALKTSSVMVTAAPDLLTTTEQQWAAMEAAACRLPIVHRGSILKKDLRKDIVLERPQAHEFTGDTVELLENHLLREQLAHKSWRAVMREHTFSHRMQTICKHVGIDFGWNEFPRATIVSPTFRIDSMHRCIEQYEKQSYPDKELIVVVNSNNTVPQGILDYIQGQEGIRIAKVPPERFAGSCMNLGHTLATGEYCFRMDDDDFYGANYISDSMLHLKSIDATLFGKAPNYFNFTRSNKTYERGAACNAMSTVNPEIHNIGLDIRISGYTMAAKTEFLRKSRYPDHSFGAADSFFLFGADFKDEVIAFMDNFNAVAARRPDLSSHTWRSPEDKLKSDSKFLCEGVECVLI